MVSWIFQKVRKTLQMKPLLLWGIRLLAGLLVWLAAIGFWAVPAAAFALNLVLSGSVALIFLRAYQGTFPEVCDLFSPFRLEQLPHLVGGMAWMSLWVFLWTLIPVAGLVLGPVKLYTYRLTPYILMTRPDVKATEAIQVSARETKGYRGKMFLADLLIYGSWALVLLLLLGLAQIRFLHVPFCVLLALAAVLGAALTPLVAGLAQAGFYDEIHSIAWPIRPTAPGTRLLHPLLTSHQPPVSSPKAQQAPTCNTAPSVAKRRPNPPGSATTAAPSWTAPHCNNQFGCQIKPAEQTFHLLSGF